MVTAAFYLATREDQATLLDYLRRTNEQSYKSLIEKLGIRR